jgi:hypothetical protein
MGHTKKILKNWKNKHSKPKQCINYFFCFFIEMASEELEMISIVGGKQLEYFNVILKGVWI